MLPAPAFSSTRPALLPLLPNTMLLLNVVALSRFSTWMLAPLAWLIVPELPSAGLFTLPLIAFTVNERTFKLPRVIDHGLENEPLPPAYAITSPVALPLSVRLRCVATTVVPATPFRTTGPVRLFVEPEVPILLESVMPPADESVNVPFAVNVVLPAAVGAYAP